MQPKHHTNNEVRKFDEREEYTVLPRKSFFTATYYDAKSERSITCIDWIAVLFVAAIVIAIGYGFAAMAHNLGPSSLR